uniref:Uncharacterized protein n=1 Tax=Arundo donax TaxID=35708 RepID=A0A0A9B0E8_ARUDO
MEAIQSDLRSACCGLAGNFLGYPPQAVVEALASDGARGLYVPVMVLYAVEGQGIGDLCRGHGVLEILLVGEHEDHRVLEVPVLEQPEELVLDDVDPSTVGAVNYYNDSMSSSVVCRP